MKRRSDVVIAAIPSMNRNPLIEIFLGDHVGPQHLECDHAFAHGVVGRDKPQSIPPIPTTECSS